MNHVTVDSPRRKRLKVVKACSQCRIKKRKCNGEQPCAPCIKTHSTCQYTNTTNTNTKLVQRKQIQRLADSSSQVTPTTITLNNKLLPTTVSSKSTSLSTLETNLSSSSITTNSILSIDTPVGTSRHDIHIPITTNNSRPRSPIRKPVTYTIQAIEQRLLEIEKALGLLLQRHYPALPALVLSSPSYSASSSSSADTSFRTYTKESMTISSTTGTVSSSDNISQGLAFADRHPPRINLTLPPLQTRPLIHSSSSSSSSGGGLALPYHDTSLLFDQKMPMLQPIQHQQDNKTNPSTIAQPHSSTFHYHHSRLHPIATAPPSCIP